MTLRNTLILVACFALSPALAITQHDAVNLLKASSEACKSIKSISYKSFLSFGDIDVKADIRQEFGSVPDVGFGNAKILVKGELETQKGAQPFSFSYDGTFFKLHEEGKGEIKTIENPDAQTVGRSLGFQYSLLVNPTFTSEAGMDKIIASMKRAELMGESKIEGRDCQQIRIFRTLKNPATQEEKESFSDWFIDKETLLPIGFVSNSIRRTVVVESVETKNQTLFDINNDGYAKEEIVTGNEPKTEGLPSKGEIFPSFKLDDVNGNQKSLNSYDADIFIVDFWGTWCGPCLLAMPDLQAIHQKYQNKKVQVIGISVHDAPGKAEKFVAKKAYSYEFLVQGDELAKRLKLDTYPTLFVLDKEGKILHAEKGRREEAMKDFEEIIQNKLKQ